MSQAEASAPAARPRLRVPLFAQVLSLVLVSLLAAQAINLAILFSLPPPVPDVYRASEIVDALRGARPDAREVAPLIVRRQSAPPKTLHMRHFTRLAYQDLQKQLNVPAQDLVVTAGAPGPVLFRPAWNVMHDRIVRSGASPTDHVLMAPFKVALRQPDGSWRVVEPAPSFPNVWQQRILLWFVLSVLALTPVAYLFARRLSAPIAGFAEAADRLGRDPDAPPLQLGGPAEIGTAAQAFNNMQERLRRYVKDRTAMIGAVAHDLRTPLTRLRFRAESAPEPLRSKMSADIDQMDAMIAATLAFVRDASHPGQRCRLELSSLVESVADELAETGAQVESEQSQPVVIEGDPVALRRMVANLLDNAVKFGARARARVYAEDGAAVIEVDDDGPGVPETERERVFEPFHRAEPSRSRETGGAGLGLAVVRSVARAHGGDAMLENRREGGLRARARLPLRAAS